LSKLSIVKSVVYANRVALNDVVREMKPTKVITGRHSKATDDFIQKLNEGIDTYYLFEQDEQTNLAIDELESYGVTKSPKVHQYL